MLEQSSFRRFLMLVGLMMALFRPALAAGEVMDPRAVTTVSAASFETVVAPDSLATIFSPEMTPGLHTASLDAEGKFPTELDGISVEIAGRKMHLIFTSPNQINFYIPADVPLGMAQVKLVNRTSNTMRMGSVEVRKVAPALFTIECLNATAAAALNGVTFTLEPFRVRTPENPGDDKRTRLSIFGTGLRAAPPAKIFLLDSFGIRYPLTVEYTGPAPQFFGLDQVNVVLERSFDGIGVVTVVAEVDGQQSNLVSVNIADTLLASQRNSPYRIQTIAGTGQAGLDGDGGPAIAAKFSEPTGLVADALGNLYLSDPTGNVVRKIRADGKIERVAGTGVAGYSGDGGLATNAQLNWPSGVAVNRLGEVIIADRDNHRIRKIGTNGIISTIAGTGVAGYNGDLQPANVAQLSAPAAVATDPFLNVIIADTGNHRVRRISADGVIATIGGTGQAGFSGDGYSALQAKFDSPSSVAADAQGTVFVADAKNYRIRRIQRDGTVRTVIGNGEAGTQGFACPALDAQLEFPVSLAVDPLGRILVADGKNGRIGRLDSDCQYRPIAGAGDPGFSGDGGPALEAKMNGPSGITTTPNGDIYVADSGNRRVRQLSASGECTELVAVYFSPTEVRSGQPITVTVSLGCPAAADRVVALTSDFGLPGMPSSVTIPQGQISVSFVLVAPPVEEPTPVTISTDGRPAGTFRIVPATNELTLTVTPSLITGGDPATGTIALGTPAPVGGLNVQVSSNNFAVPLNKTVTVPEGATTVQFAIPTYGVKDRTEAIVTATAGALTAAAPLTLFARDSNPIAGLTVTPNPANGGTIALGEVTLSGPAPVGGETITLISGNPAFASVPANVTIPVGQTKVTFPVTIAPTNENRSVTLTASGPGTAQTVLSILPGETNSETMAGFSIAPAAVTGGQGATGTITLHQAAGAGGVQVSLSGDDAAASAPASVTVPEGQTTVTFSVTTTTVQTETPVMFTAVAGNVITASVLVNPASSGPGSGTISGFGVSPATVVGGQANPTGTVTLSAPAGPGGVLVNLGSDNGAASVPASITIPQGQSSGSFTVSTSAVGSTTPVVLTATSANTSTAGLTLNAPSAGSGTISGFGVSPASVIGGQANPTGTVTLSAPAGPGGVLVNLSSNNGAASVPASITIPQGQSNGSFTVTTSTVGSTTPVVLTATSANTSTAGLTLNAPSAGSGTISGFGVSPTTAVGGQTNPTGTVTLSAPAGLGGVLVTLSSDNGAASVPASMTIPQGQSSGSFTVSTSAVGSTTPVVLTATSANTSTAGLTLNAPSAGSGTISGFGVSPASVVGGQANPTGTVTLSAPAGPGGVLVNLSSDHGSTSVPASITIPQGQSSGSFTVTTSAVGSTTPVVLTATSANSSTAGLTLTAPMGLAGLSLSPTSVVAGFSSTGTVTLNQPAGAGGVTVALSSNNAAASVPASITVPQGQTSASFSVATTSVASTQNAVISAAANGSEQHAQLTIVPPTGVSGLSVTPGSVNGGSSATGTVTLTEPAGAGGVTVALSSNNGAASVPANVTVPQGQTSATFTVTTSSVATTQNAVISASANGSEQHAPLTIVPVTGVAGVSVSPSSVTGGSSATGTVTLTQPAGPGGTTVALGSNNGAATVPASVTVPAGQTSANFTVSTTPVSSNQTVNISASLNGSEQSASLTVQAPCIGGLTLNVGSVLGGSGALGTVTLTGPAPAGGALIQLASSNAAVQVPTSVLVPAGQTSANFSVTTVGVLTLLTSTIEGIFGPCGGITVNLDVQAPILQALGFSNGLSLLNLTSTGTVSLNGPAPAGGIVVSLGANAGLLMPSTVTIPAGQTSANFTVNILSTVLSQLVGTLSSITVNATSALGNLAANIPISLL